MQLSQRGNGQSIDVSTLYPTRFYKKCYLQCNQFAQADARELATREEIMSLKKWRLVSSS